MKAAVLVEPSRLELQDIQEPAPSAGEALVAVRSVGVCGTDLKIVSGAIKVDFPRVIGHEIVGVVVGTGAEGSSVGRVLVDPGVACGSCIQCREGRSNICTRGWLLGRDRDGGLREFMAVPASNLHPIPDAVPDDVAPLLQVLTTCLHAQRMSTIFPGDTVVILGMGVTGLLHLQLARLRGATVLCTTRSEWKLELARELGADQTIAFDGAGIDQIVRATGNGADLVIDCVGSVATLAKAISIARVGGRVMSYGTIAETSGALPFYDLYYKEITLTNPRASRPEDFSTAINVVSSGRVRLEPLLSHRFELAQAAEALASSASPDSLKVVVEL
jgi:2-desacetyl-2-hydroxyethyl bacteriochlorophyllide A dehydrogenase